MDRSCCHRESAEFIKAMFKRDWCKEGIRIKLISDFSPQVGTVSNKIKYHYSFRHKKVFIPKATERKRVRTLLMVNQ